MEIKACIDSEIDIDNFNIIFNKWSRFHIENIVFDINNIKKDIKKYIRYCWYNGSSYFTHFIVDDKSDLLCLLDIYMDENKEYTNIIVISIIDKINLWYNIIKQIRIFFSDRTKYIKIDFNYLDKHPIIKKIITYFGGLFNKDRTYILPLRKFDCKFNDNINIEIILYQNSSKTKKLFIHKSNIIITKNIIKDKFYSSRIINSIFINKNKKINNNYHKFSKNSIIFEKPLILFNDIANNTSDIWIDIYINQKKIILDNHDFRLNKIKDISINDYKLSYIYSIYSIKYDCECNLCTSIDKISNPYYFINESSKILYEFIDVNFNNVKSCKYKFYDINDTKINLDIDYNISSLFENKNNFEDSIKNDCSYIYLIEKYDVNEKTTIFKFGKTNRNIHERLKEHGREGKILLILDVNDCSFIEKKNLQILSNDENIKKLKKFGNEYFYCENKNYIVEKIIKNIYNS